MIPETMQEAMLYGIGDLRIKEVPVPSIGPKEVLVRVKKCAVCPTDVRKYHYENYNPLKLPTNLGHEWSGDVAKVGDEVKGFQPGMRVGGEGFFGYAEYGKVTEDLLPYLLPLPEEVSYEEATFLEPMSDCIYALSRRVKLQIRETILVVGAGPMGLQFVGLAKMMGAKVIVSELSPERRQMALEFGADFVLDPDEAPLQEQIKDVNNGKLVEVSVISVGTPAAMNAGIMSAGKRGRVVFFGGGPKGTTVEIDPNWIHYNELTVLGSEWIGLDPEPQLYPRALDIIASKQIPVARLVSEKYPLAKLVDAIKAAARLDTLKVIVEL